MLDVDGNGAFGALTDGRLISRYLAGSRGAALVGGSVIGADATRTTAAAIESYLQGFIPAVPLAPASAPASLFAASSEAPVPAAVSSAASTVSPVAKSAEVVAPTAGSITPNTSAPTAAAVTPNNGLTSAVVIDWSRVWRSAKGDEFVSASDALWPRPSVLDFSEHEDPNLGMELVVATR